MFKLIILIIVFAIEITSGTKLNRAKNCDRELCKLPNCRCASNEIPGNFEKINTPQFVFLTFDDAITALNHDKYYVKIFNKNKINPDNCSITGTFFLSHEYTDYSKVHDLYINGHEIALHSITHTPLTTYWQNISINDLIHEFGDEKKLVAYFANIPEESIKGMRLPFLQLSGDKSFNVMKQIGLEYDCSWPTQIYRYLGLWPYTLDYLSNQDCPVGPCPRDSLPGAWVVPMIDWEDNNNIVCAMIDSCVNIPTDEDKLLQWYIDNFNKQYYGSRSPFGFYVHAAWFDRDPIHFSSYLKFIDYLLQQPNVYIVNIQTALKWIKNPTPLNSNIWTSCQNHENLGCEPPGMKPLVCPLNKDGGIRYMTICGMQCPDVYPWLNNPYGKK